MLPSPSRLRRTADIGRVRQRGRRWQHPLVVLFVDTQPQECSSDSRFAFAVGRHIGKATQRNRVKRRLREIVRRKLDRVVPGLDCLFVARTGAVTATHEELELAVMQLMYRGGILLDARTHNGEAG